MSTAIFLHCNLIITVRFMFGLRKTFGHDLHEELNIAISVITVDFIVFVIIKNWTLRVKVWPQLTLCNNSPSSKKKLSQNTY